MTEAPHVWLLGHSSLSLDSVAPKTCALKRLVVSLFFFPLQSPLAHSHTYPGRTDRIFTVGIPIKKENRRLNHLVIMVSRKSYPKDVHFLIPRTCECVNLCGRRDFVDVIKVKYLRWKITLDCQVGPCRYLSS